MPLLGNLDYWHIPYSLVVLWVLGSFFVVVVVVVVNFRNSYAGPTGKGKRPVHLEKSLSAVTEEEPSRVLNCAAISQLANCVVITITVFIMIMKKALQQRCSSLPRL